MAPILKDLIQRSRSQALCRCYFCDFPFGSAVQQEAELHHLNGDHSDNNAANVVLTCTLCHDAWHLDLLGRRYGEKGVGQLVFLPEISQIDLNKLLAAAFFAMECAPRPEDVQRMARPSSFGSRPAPMRRARRGAEDEAETGVPVSPHAVMNRLIERADQLERMKSGLSDPLLVARMLSGLDEEAYAKREALLFGVRYLPSFDAHRSRVRSWGGVGGPFGALPMESWASVLQEH